MPVLAPPVEPAAAALVFDPPMYDPGISVALIRNGREPAAFVAFDELTTTYFHIRTDDRQTEDGFGRYERRAIIHRVGKSYR